MFTSLGTFTLCNLTELAFCYSFPQTGKAYIKIQQAPITLLKINVAIAFALSPNPQTVVLRLYRSNYLMSTLTADVYPQLSGLVGAVTGFTVTHSFDSRQFVSGRKGA
jgi:hypothetical protein